MTPHRPRGIAARNQPGDWVAISRFAGDSGDRCGYNAFLTQLSADARATGVAVQ